MTAGHSVLEKILMKMREFASNILFDIRYFKQSAFGGHFIKTYKFICRDTETGRKYTIRITAEEDDD